MSTLLSIKTGGCPEDCAYCPQSARYDTGVEREKLMPLDAVLRARAARQGRPARRASAWARPSARPKAKDLRADCADGPRGQRARAGDLRHARHADAGAGAARSRTPASTTTTTISTPRRSSTARSSRPAPTRTGSTRSRRCATADMKVCCGGIVGMGESRDDRARLLMTLANLPQHPESVPINQLVRVPGTPLDGTAPRRSVRFRAHHRGRAHHDAARSGAPLGRARSER